MRKGAAVGAGPGPERRPSSDPRLPGAIPLPAPPRRPWAGAGAAVAGGLGLGTVGAGSAACPGRGAWPGSAGSEPPLMDFFRAFGCEYFRFGTLAVSSSFFASPSNPATPAAAAPARAEGRRGGAGRGMAQGRRGSEEGRRSGPGPALTAAPLHIAADWSQRAGDVITEQLRLVE
uniref:Uncharacterized protein n=1 Tax=Setaria italica TaxID=4555 RepID=A0A0Q3PZQ3_SETIT